MKTPLPGDTTIIPATLQEHWQLKVTDIHFIPFGDSAYSYRVETATQTSYYLKIADRQTYAGIRAAAHMEFSLPLQRFVAEYGLAEVAAPLPQLTSQGAYHASHGPLLFALYTFIHGKEEVRVLMSTRGLVRHGEADWPVSGRSI